MADPTNPEAPVITIRDINSHSHRSKHTAVVGDHLRERKTFFCGMSRPNAHVAEQVRITTGSGNDGQQTVHIAGSNDPAGVDLADDQGRLRLALADDNYRTSGSENVVQTAGNADSHHPSDE